MESPKRWCPAKPSLSGPTAHASLGRKAAFLSQRHQDGLNHQGLSDLLDVKTLFQLLSLGPGRTPYSHTSLLAYTAHMPRKPASIWAQEHPRRSPGTQLPSEHHLVSDPHMDKAYSVLAFCWDSWGITPWNLVQVLLCDWNVSEWHPWTLWRALACLNNAMKHPLPAFWGLTKNFTLTLIFRPRLLKINK